MKMAPCLSDRVMSHSSMYRQSCMHQVLKVRVDIENGRVKSSYARRKLKQPGHFQDWDSAS